GSRDGQRPDAPLLEAVGTTVSRGPAAQRLDEVCSCVADAPRLAALAGARRGGGQAGPARSPALPAGAEPAPAEEGARYPAAAAAGTGRGAAEVTGTDRPGEVEESGQDSAAARSAPGALSQGPCLRDGCRGQAWPTHADVDLGR